MRRGTGSRAVHCSSGRRHSFHVHVNRFSLGLRLGVRPIRSHGRGVTSTDLMGDVNECDEKSGACRSWRIARSCCPNRSGDVAGQSRRRRGGPGKLEAGVGYRGALASPLASSLASLAPPLINASWPFETRQARFAGLFFIRKACAQSQFLNFQDLSFHGVSVSNRHCTTRSGGQ